MARRKHRHRQFVAKQERITMHQLPFNGRVVADIVDNPYASGPLRIDVTRSIRDDPLAGLFSRRHIDAAQFHAGRRWQHYYETAGIGMVRALDPLKEPVDGGGANPAGFTDAQHKAFHKLKHARAMLGLAGYQLVREVLGDGLEIQAIAKRRGYLTQRDAIYLGKRFRECLETLAVGWGYAALSTATTPKPVHNLRATRSC
jgi:hypothetical protein